MQRRRLRNGGNALRCEWPAEIRGLFWARSCAVRTAEIVGVIGWAVALREQAPAGGIFGLGEDVPKAAAGMPHWNAYAKPNEINELAGSAEE